MNLPEPDNLIRERIEDLCNVASHLSAGRTITLDITPNITFDDPPSRVEMLVSNEIEPKKVRDSFGTDLAWGIEQEYFLFDRLDGALTFGPKHKGLLDQCVQMSKRDASATQK